MTLSGLLDTYKTPTMTLDFTDGQRPTRPPPWPPTNRELRLQVQGPTQLTAH